MYWGKGRNMITESFGNLKINKVKAVLNLSLEISTTSSESCRIKGGALKNILKIDVRIIV